MHSSQREWSVSEMILQKSIGYFRQAVRDLLRARPRAHSVQIRGEKEEDGEEDEF